MVYTVVIIMMISGRHRFFTILDTWAEPNVCIFKGSALAEFLVYCGKQKVWGGCGELKGPAQQEKDEKYVFSLKKPGLGFSPN